MKTDNLIFYRIPYSSDFWHKFRTIGITEAEGKQFGCPAYEGGIGASEISTILGVNKSYRPLVQEYYHHKIGTEQPKQEVNADMLLGKVFESIIKEFWCCYDGTDDGWVGTYAKYDNALAGERKGIKIRDARKVNAYIVNKKYPYLFVSLDYWAEKNTPGIDGTIYPDGFSTECKSIGHWYAQLWEANIPEYHLPQVNQQMLVTETDYAEIPILIGGKKFKVFPCHRDDEICERIIKHGETFWKKIMAGREYKKVMDNMMAEGDVEGYNEARAYIDSGEPEVTDNEKYQEWINERFKAIVNSINGDIPLFNKAREYDNALNLIKFIESHQTLIKNQMLHILDQKNAEEIDFKALGKITFNKNKNDIRSLRFKLNIKATDEQLKTQFNKLDFTLKT